MFDSYYELFQGNIDQVFYDNIFPVLAWLAIGLSFMATMIYYYGIGTITTKWATTGKYLLFILLSCIVSFAISLLFSLQYATSFMSVILAIKNFFLIAILIFFFSILLKWLSPNNRYVPF